MNSEPSEDAVSQLLAMGVASSREEAISTLKVNGNNVQRAIEAIFEAPSTDPLHAQQQARDSWDESQFHTDKNDQSNQDGSSYSHQAVDHLQPDVFGAPSRPPSRVTERGVIDLTSEHASADPTKSLGFDNQREEQDIQRAMELSMSELEPQESGVTSQKGVHFGPARRDYYDANKWSLTTTHEIVLEPDASDRKLVDGEPPFLKPSPSSYYLAPFLTILHRIPLAREVLLCRDFILEDYGFDEDWWNGSMSKGSSLKTLDGPNAAREYDQVIGETQRLMAFLDMTLRSYGAAEGLARLDKVKDQDLDVVLANFVVFWRDAVRARSQSCTPSTLFESTGVKLLSSTGEELGRQGFSLLDLRPETGVAGSTRTLYDAMDDMIWEGPQINDDTVTYLERVAEVFTIRLSRPEHGNIERAIDVPVKWYPDRYLEESKGMAREMRSKKAAIHKEIEKMDDIHRRLTTFQPPNGQAAVDPRRVMQMVIGRFEQILITKAELENNDNNGNPGGSSPYYPSVTPEFVRKVKAISVSVEAKLIRLEQQQKEARENLTEVSALLTRSSADPAYTPRHGYTLRGVSTDPHVIYILCPVDEGNMTRGTRTEGAEEEHVNVMADGPAVTEQWWRISYLSGEAKPVQKLKVSEEQVLKAAREEGKAALLVYASEMAMDQSHTKPLPEALINAVQADNESFRLEVEGAQAGLSLAHRSSGPAWASPPKRKASHDELDAEWGSRTPPGMTQGNNDDHGMTEGPSSFPDDNHLAAELDQHQKQSSVISPDVSSSSEGTMEVEGEEEQGTKKNVVVEEEEPGQQEMEEVGKGRTIMGRSP